VSLSHFSKAGIQDPAIVTLV